MKFHLSFFHNRFDVEPKQQMLAWDDFADFLSAPDVRLQKDGALFNGAVLDGTRNNENVKSLSLMMLDFDEGDPTFAEVIATCKELGFAFAAYTTFSHSPELEKFRVIVPLAAPIPAADYPKLWQWMRGHFPTLDIACKDLSRMFYAPAIQSNEAPYLWHIEAGEWLDWQTLDYSTVQPKPERPQLPRYTPKPGDKRLTAYLNAVFEGACDRVANAAEGTGNVTLLNQSRLLAGYLHFGVYSADQIEHHLDSATYNWTRRKNVSQTIRNGIRMGEASPILSIPDNPNWNPSARASAPACAVAESGPDWEQQVEEISQELDTHRVYEFTEEGMLERIASRLTDFRFVPEWSKWLAYNGEIWDANNGEALLFMAVREVVGLCKAEDLRECDAKHKAKRLKYYERYQTFAGLKAVIELAKRDTRFLRPSSGFDSHALLVNCKNGTLNLATGDLQPFHRDDYLTQQIQVNYNRAAECANWKRFLEQVVPAAEMRLYIQQACGYSLTGLTTEQCMFILYGGGSNGKSTFVEALEFILKDYHIKAAMTTFSIRESDNTSDLARMRSARFVTVSENDENARLSEGLIKTATGDREITARFLYQNPFTYTPFFKVWMCVNHRPIIRGQDDGIWRRLKLIPFEVKITDEQKDKELGAKLRDEAEGILAWMVRGCLDWRINGLRTPDQIKAATDGYREEMDTLGRWIEDRCETDENFSEGSTELYTDFAEWAKKTGEPVLSLTAFGRRLGDRGYASVREGGTGKKMRKGLRLVRLRYS